MSEKSSPIKSTFPEKTLALESLNWRTSKGVVAQATGLSYERERTLRSCCCGLRVFRRTNPAALDLFYRPPACSFGLHVSVSRHFPKSKRLIWL